MADGAGLNRAISFNEMTLVVAISVEGVFGH